MEDVMPRVALLAAAGGYIGKEFDRI